MKSAIMAETMIASSHVKSEHCTRKNKKPLMEKRRRARINSCLTQLKSLVLQAIKKDSSQFSKLEKADILELTVKHLRTMQRQQAAGVLTQDPTVAHKYRAGYNECANEVVRYMESVPDVNDEVKGRVLGHLGMCVQIINNATPVEALQQQQHHHQQQQSLHQQNLHPQQHHHQQMKPLHVHIPSQAALAGLPTSVAPSVIVPTPQNAGMRVPVSNMTFQASPLRCSASPDTQTPSPVSATPLSSLPLQTPAVSQSHPHPHPQQLQQQHQQISGAFKIVPSSACPSGAVALYLGNHLPRGGEPRVEAVPLYSLALPQAEGGITAFVPPAPSSSSSSSSYSSSRVSPVPVDYPAAAVPVDLRHKVKVGGEPTGQSLSYRQWSPASMADEKLWRPW